MMRSCIAQFQQDKDDIISQLYTLEQILYPTKFKYHQINFLREFYQRLHVIDGPLTVSCMMMRLEQIGFYPSPTPQIKQGMVMHQFINHTVNFDIYAIFSKSPKQSSLLTSLTIQRTGK